jgi:hypothetical protein
MAESLESRKFDRKPLFDVPLPMRRKDRDATTSTESNEPVPVVVAPTMAFSLLTKRGNRQQVSLIIHLLLTTLTCQSDSHGRITIGLQFRDRNEDTAAGRERGTTTN